MLEVFFMLFAGVIVYSIFQGIRRGSVSPEERKNNPTLIERSSTFIDEMADVAIQLSESSSKYLEQTRFEARYCAWFDTFENSISGTLEVAERIAALEKRLDADPAFKRIFLETGDQLRSIRDKSEALTGAIEKLPRKTAVEWVAIGMPTPPQAEKDPEKSATYQYIYNKRLTKHRTFVKNARERLRKNLLLRATFEDIMNTTGRAEIIRTYFSDEIVLKHVQTTGGSAMSIILAARNDSTDTTAADLNSKAINLELL